MHLNFSYHSDSVSAIARIYQCRKRFGISAIDLPIGDPTGSTTKLVGMPDEADIDLGNLEWMELTGSETPNLDLLSRSRVDPSLITMTEEFPGPAEHFDGFNIPLLDDEQSRLILGGGDLFDDESQLESTPNVRYRKITNRLTDQGVKGGNIFEDENGEDQVKRPAFDEIGEEPERKKRRIHGNKEEGGWSPTNGDQVQGPMTILVRGILMQ